MKESKILRVIMLSATVCIASIACRKSSESPVVPVTGVTFNENTVSLIAGSKIMLTPVVIPDNAANKQVNLSSDNDNIATVDTDGLVTGKSAGTAVITAVTSDGGKTATCTVIVTVAAVAVTGITLTPQTASIEENKTVQVTANVLPSNATNKSVSWKSDHTNIATVDAGGLVTGKSAGTAVITAVTSDGKKTATCTVIVTAAAVAVTGITLTPQTASVEENKTVQVTANVSPSNATDKNVSWESGSTNIATVDADGLVTGKSAGTAVITATTFDGKKNATCTVSVTNTNV
ncbi:MAG: Ig-like domain-containing protein, partial [Prevotellaceae bacterium]|nr:Ig-like domain-containing protein [Prevotellaceae bacterium]